MSATTRLKSVRNELSDSSQSAIQKAFEEFAREAEVLESLQQYAAEIDSFRARGISEERIANRLAIALNTEPDAILSFLRSPKGRLDHPGNVTDTNHQPDSQVPPPEPRSRKEAIQPSASKSRESTAPPARVPASDIRNAIEGVMKQRKIKSFKLNDETTVGAIVQMVPSLNGLQKHERNRKIIDACAGRKNGPIVISHNGKREIGLAG